MERTNTKRFELFPEGTYLFTVTQAPEKFRTETDKIRYVWKFSTTIDGRPREYKESMMVWLMGDLLRALECQEITPDDFEWEVEEVVGKIIWGTIKHEPDRRDLKENKPNPRMWARMTDIQSTKDKAKEDEEKIGLPF